MLPLTNVFPNLIRSIAALFFLVRISVRTSRNRAQATPVDFWLDKGTNFIGALLFLLFLFGFLRLAGGGESLYYDVNRTLAITLSVGLALSWIAISLVGQNRGITYSHLLKLVGLSWSQAQAYAACLCMAAVRPVPLLVLVSYLGIGFILFPRLGTIERVLAFIGTGIFCFGIVCWVEAVRCMLERLSFGRGLRYGARLVGVGLAVGFSIYLAYRYIDSAWVAPFVDASMAVRKGFPTDILPTMSLTGSRELNDLLVILAGAGAFATAGCFIGWRATRWRIFVCGVNSSARDASPYDRIDRAVFWLGRVLPTPYPILVARELVYTLRWRRMWMVSGFAVFLVYGMSINPAIALYLGKDRAAFTYPLIPHMIGLLWLAFGNVSISTNIFAKDYHSVCYYLQLPIRAKEVILSKNIVVIAFQMALVVVCSPAIVFVFWFYDMIGTALVVLLGLVLYPVPILIAGNYASILSPYLTSHSIRDMKGGRLMSGNAALAMFGVNATCLPAAAGLLFFGVGGARWVTWVLGLAVLALGVSYSIAIQHQSRLLEQRRSRVSESLLRTKE